MLLIYKSEKQRRERKEDKDREEKAGKGEDKKKKENFKEDKDRQEKAGKGEDRRKKTSVVPLRATTQFCSSCCLLSPTLKSRRQLGELTCAQISASTGRYILRVY